MPTPRKQTERRQKSRRFISEKPPKRENVFRMHPLFLCMGIWYALQGRLFLFLMSALVAIQHECAHAFAAARLGYRLNKIVLMPFGAVIDGDLRGIGLKEELTVAVCGPLANLLTASFFAAIWWFEPTVYAFTDTACFSSLSVALVNLLPAYPLDGGRILRCILAEAFLKNTLDERKAERKAERLCLLFTLFFASCFLLAFLILCFQNTFNFSLLAFSLFLFVGAFGNKGEQASYGKMDFSKQNALQKGVEIKRVAVLFSCPVKRAIRFLSKDSYLVLEVYDGNENKLFELTQNELSELFILSKTPYDTLGGLYAVQKETPEEKFG